VSCEREFISREIDFISRVFSAAKVHIFLHTQKFEKNRQGAGVKRAETGAGASLYFPYCRVYFKLSPVHALRATVSRRERISVEKATHIRATVSRRERISVEKATHILAFVRRT
jgi:hypothetical protein